MSPIEDSYERLVIGIAVCTENDFHLEIVNAMHRLDCYFGMKSKSVRYAIEMTCGHLEGDLSKRGLEALRAPNLLSQSASLGELREGQANSLEELARNWLKALSSLQEADVGKIADQIHKIGQDNPGSLTERANIPSGVQQYISSKEIRLRNNFNLRSVEGARRKNASDVIIDYKSNRVIANFGEIPVGKISTSVDKIKRRLWDLKIHRDDNDKADLHQMLVKIPNRFETDASDKQIENIQDAVHDLEYQADQESLRLIAFPSLEEIGERILKVELAA